MALNLVDIEMDSRTLLQIINKGEKAKQFWEKFLGKDILDELLKYPELLSMQDAKRAKVTKEEKKMDLNLKEKNEFLIVFMRNWVSILELF